MFTADASGTPLNGVASKLGESHVIAALGSKYENHYTRSLLSAKGRDFHSLLSTGQGLRWFELGWVSLGGHDSGWVG